MSAQILPFPTTYEPWVSKRQIAQHYGRTPRWVERRMAEGMPHQKDGSHQQARTRFRISEVEAWFNARSA